MEFSPTRPSRSTRREAMSSVSTSLGQRTTSSQLSFWSVKKLIIYNILGAQKMDKASVSVKGIVHMKCSVVQCSAMQCNAVQCSAMQCSAMQCNAVQCSAMRYNAVQCSAMHCNAMHCNGLQCNAMRCTAVWCSAVQCNAGQTSAVDLISINFLI